MRSPSIPRNGRLHYPAGLTRRSSPRSPTRRCSMSQAPAPREHDRRGFLKILATAFTVLPAAARAQAPSTPTTPPPAPPATTTAPAAPAGPEHSTSEARLLTEVLRARYPDRFTETQ